MLSTGGYHNSMSPQAINGLAACWADLARLAERHIEHLWVGPGKRQSQRVEELLSLLLMVAAGYTEEATAAAQPTLLVRAAPSQNDIGSPAFLAWRRVEAAGRALDAVLAILLAVGTVLLRAEDRSAPEALRGRVAAVGALYPDVQHSHPEGLAAIAAAIADEIHRLKRASRWRSRWFPRRSCRTGAPVSLPRHGVVRPERMRRPLVRTPGRGTGVP